jgi:hypothetical protein
MHAKMEYEEQSGTRKIARRKMETPLTSLLIYDIHRQLLVTLRLKQRPRKQTLHDAVSLQLLDRPVVPRPGTWV